MIDYLRNRKEDGMRSYLDLIGLSARVHRRQDRMTLLCIFLAVFLVTAICGMADMEVRSQRIRMLKDYGNWHIRLSGITEEDAALVAMRPGVDAVVWYDVVNYRLDQEYRLGDRKIVVAGYGEGVDAMLDGNLSFFQEGRYPAEEWEVALTQNARELYGLKVGDEVTIDLPEGSFCCTVSGFAKNVGSLMREDVVGAFLTKEGFQNMISAKEAPSAKEDVRDGAEDGTAAYNKAEDGISPDRDTAVWYVRFSDLRGIRRSIEEIRESLWGTKAVVAENTGLLSTYGLSSDPSMTGLVASAMILFLLVLTAGVLMISGAMNSNVSQRTAFFGLLRCLGASGKQVRGFVRREALRWCRRAAPAGVAAGTVVIWILCGFLSWMSPTYFGDMPRFAVSPIAWLSGIAVGYLTVLLAARAPARRAVGVPPLAAVSGDGKGGGRSIRASGIGWLRVETALGISHALAGYGGKRRGGRPAGRNLLLMGGSFAFSIILFLSFSVAVRFMDYAVKPLRPSAPDLSVMAPEEGPGLDRGLVEELESLPGVERAYGRAFAYDLVAAGKDGEVGIDLVSYEKYQLAWAQKDLLWGSLADLGREGTSEEEVPVLMVYDPAYPVSCGDRFGIGTQDGIRTAVVAGILSKIPFDGSPGKRYMICGEGSFRRLTGEEDLTVVDIQMVPGATDKDVEEVRETAGEGVGFSDRRLSNAEVRGAFWSFALFVYGFLAVIALITLLNIMNSIGMSVAVRIRQYGAMRAIGMSCVQLERMVLAEALTYAVGGSVAGGILGLWMHRFLFRRMITERWGSPWEIPYGALAGIVALVLLSSAAAIYGPVKRIRGMSIVETISAR